MGGMFFASVFSGLFDESDTESNRNNNNDSFTTSFHTSLHRYRLENWWENIVLKRSARFILATVRMDPNRVNYCQREWMNT